MHKILVAGGAGYIGSHTIVDLIEKGFEVVSADNFINSFPESLAGIEKITGKKIKNYPIDLCSEEGVKKVFQENQDIAGIIHFAALKSVEESVQNPMLYFNNNIKALLNLLDYAEDYDVTAFIFSSSCTVYGQADELPATEDTPMKEAESPYGRTKQIGEYILQDSTLSNNLNIVSLRYFNPAGAHHSALIGEAPKVKAVNLIPVIAETAIGKREKVFVHGNDYPTRDGSCIRDYIHVMDLADAHEKALSYVLNDKNEQQYEVFNLGIGEGVTVLEAINAFEKTTRIELNYEIGPRRAGDILAIYADSHKALIGLEWKPKYTIEDIMTSAWNWEKNRAF